MSTFKEIITEKGNFRETSERLGEPYTLEERWWDFQDLIDDLWFKIMPIHWIYRLPHNLFQDWPREVKWAWQRVFTGYDERVGWSVYSYLGPIIITALKNFKKDFQESRHCGYPITLFNEDGTSNENEKANCEAWVKMLNDMIEGFEYLVDSDKDWDEICEEFGDDRKEGETFPRYKIDVKKWNSKCNEESIRRYNEATKKAMLFITNFGSLWD